MRFDSLDLSHETTSLMLSENVKDHRAWLSMDSDPRSVVISLDEEIHAETRLIVSALNTNPLPLFLRNPDDFKISGWRRVMRQAKNLLDKGPGLTVIDRLPMEEFNEEDIKPVDQLLAQ